VNRKANGDAKKGRRDPKRAISWLQRTCLYGGSKYQFFPSWWTVIFLNVNNLVIVQKVQVLVTVRVVGTRRQIPGSLHVYITSVYIE